MQHLEKIVRITRLYTYIYLNAKQYKVRKSFDRNTFRSTFRMHLAEKMANLLLLQALKFIGN